jgi:hypothetical protein
MQYDRAGNLVYDGRFVYAYDFKSRLVAIRDTWEPYKYSEQVYFYYDAGSPRLQRTRSRPDPGRRRHAHVGRSALGQARSVVPVRRKAPHHRNMDNHPKAESRFRCWPGTSSALATGARPDGSKEREDRRATS